MSDVTIALILPAGVVLAAEAAGLSPQAWAERALRDAAAEAAFESSAGVAVLAARLDVGVPSRSAFADRRQRAGGQAT